MDASPISLMDDLLPIHQRQQLHWMREDVRARLNCMKFHDLSVASRGLLYSLLIYSWWQGPIPNNAERIARTIRSPLKSVEKALPALIEGGFFVLSPDGQWLVNPSLEAEVKVSHRMWSGHRQGGQTRAAQLRAEREAVEAAQALEAEEWLAQNSQADGDPQERGS